MFWRGAIRQMMSRIRFLQHCDRIRRAGLHRFLLFVPPGHFYSPIPSMHDVERATAPDPRTIAEIPGLDLNDAVQMDLLRRFQGLSASFRYLLMEQPDSRPGVRYSPRNTFYPLGDALVLGCMMLAFRPRRMVEAGCGHSSAHLLDVNAQFFGGKIEICLIDPHFDRLKSILREEDLKACTLLEMPVQEVPMSTFESLEPGDFLLIDSSHVVKAGSDVNYLLAQVLPALKPGVIIHFHDIFWPFEYPRDWYQQGRAWNEAYMLRSFLQFNRAFEILFFTSYLWTFHPDQVRQALPGFSKGTGSGLWLRRVEG